MSLLSLTWVVESLLRVEFGYHVLRVHELRWAMSVNRLRVKEG